MKSKTILIVRFSLAASLFSIMTCVARPVSAVTSCGGTSQPRCEVSAAVDSEMTNASNATKSAIDSKNAEAKGKLADIPDEKFSWSFIPQIPTAECVNPQIDSPIGAYTVEMDVCSKFETFKVFINGVLAFFCILGCAQQIRAAMAVN